MIYCRLFRIGIYSGYFILFYFILCTTSCHFYTLIAFVFISATLQSNPNILSWPAHYMRYAGQALQAEMLTFLVLDTGRFKLA